MITKSKQNWTVGSVVRVGFLTLTITAIVPTPGDGMPDEYLLVSAKGAKYSFVPHNGLVRLA
jgi:hypothetical protein